MKKAFEPSGQCEIEVIAHRGLSNLFPENTKEAIVSALNFAHLVQLDILLTKDDQIIVFHDRGLSRLTDISSFSQFAHRVSTSNIEDQEKLEKNWWVRDFTYEQLRQLSVRQPLKHRPQLPSVFKISKLEDVIRQCLAVKSKTHNINKLHSGLLIQLKSEAVNKVSNRDMQMCRRLLVLLKQLNLDTRQGCSQANLPVILQSFSLEMLQFMSPLCQNQFVLLFKKHVKITEELLARTQIKRIRGIGITQQTLSDDKGLPCNQVKILCDQMGYKLYYWTIRDDDYDKIPFKCTSYSRVYELLRKLGVTGFITQFPDKCKGFLGLQSTKFPLEKDEKADKQCKKIIRACSEIETQVPIVKRFSQ